jgi:hypothetical protein
MAKHYIDDFKLNVSRGVVQGTTQVHVLGYNPDIDPSSDPETVWFTGGAYPWEALSTAKTLHITSTSSSDTMGLVITGLNTNFVQVTETITLTGTTPVVTSNQYLRINDAYTLNGVNVGTIDMRVDSNSGTIVDSIAPGYGQNTTGIYTIPAGKVGYLYAGDASVGMNKQTTVVFRMRLVNGSLRVAHIAEISNGAYRYDFHFPQILPEKTDIEVYVINTQDQNTRVACNFDIVLLDKPIVTQGGTGIPDPVV